MRVNVILLTEKQLSYNYFTIVPIVQQMSAFISVNSKTVLTSSKQQQHSRVIYKCVVDLFFFSPEFCPDNGQSTLAETSTFIV